VLRTFGDGRLFGSSTGNRTPAVLALHGWARSSRDFDAVLSPTGSEPLDAVALDLAGFGVAPPPPTAWGSAEYAAAVAPILDEMARPAVVLGHSFGGRVAVQLAVTRPDDIKALVLTGVPLPVRPGRGRPRLGFRFVRGLARAHLVGEERLEAARQRYGSADYRAAQGVMRQVLVRSVAEHYETQLAAITCPVTMVWGDDDTAAPLAQAEEAAKLLSNAELRVIHGAGHLTVLSAPGQLRDAVNEALRR
jgi:pimeloyl-ACP methyl ester carboxylesterase